MINAADNLKIISRNGVGHDTVDGDALSERGIPLTVVGDVNSTSVAEHTLMLILATAKRVIAHDASIREDRWAVRDSLLSIDIEDKVLLIFGFGRIGQKVAMRATSFGMDVLVHDPYINPSIVTAAGARNAITLQDGLAAADFITLHIPATGGKPILGEKELSMMKPTAVVINTSRGSHIDESALIKALNSKKLSGAGLDVFSPEPPAADNPLYQLDNVILSPHIAGFTAQCAARMAHDAAQNIIDAIDGKLNPSRVVNAEAIGLK